MLQHVDDLYNHKISKILYCYSVHQTLYTEMEESIPNITFYKGIPDEKYLHEFQKGQEVDSHYVMVLDDLQSSTVLESREMLHIATVLSHHMRYNVVLILQNLFGQGKYSRSILLQSAYYISLHSPRDNQVLANLSRQIFGSGRSQVIPQVMADVSRRRRYAYVVTDLSPHSEDDRFTLRSCIFPDDPYMEIYVVKRS